MKPLVAGTRYVRDPIIVCNIGSGIGDGILIYKQSKCLPSTTMYEDDHYLVVSKEMFFGDTVNEMSVRYNIVLHKKNETNFL